jgi:hypothetical protein
MTLIPVAAFGGDGELGGYGALFSVIKLHITPEVEAP